MFVTLIMHTFSHLRQGMKSSMCVQNINDFQLRQQWMKGEIKSPVTLETRHEDLQVYSILA